MLSSAFDRSENVLISWDILMPKMKTNRGAAKRFRKTGGSRVKRGSAYRRHILTKKTTKRKRQLRKLSYIAKGDMASLDKLLP